MTVECNYKQLLGGEMLQRFVKSIRIRSESLENKVLSSYRRSRIKCRDFSIISNNCWGGHVYRRFGLSYSSPTIGLFFFTDDYLRFLADLKRYLQTPLTFISVDESVHREELLRRQEGNMVIGRIDDVEIMFLHYASRQEAREKWERRAQRVNYKHLIIKISQMNDCSDEDIRTFALLPYRNKVIFTAHPVPGVSSQVISDGEQGIRDDTTFFYRYVHLESLINTLC